MASSWTLYLQEEGKELLSTIPVLSSDCVQTVKTKIQSQKGFLPHLQRLFHNGQELIDSSATLRSYGVQNWGELALVVSQTPTTENFDLSIKTLSGKNFFVSAKPGDTVADVCSEIWRQEGIPSEQQQLIYGGKVLDWDRTLDHYCIQRESALHVVYAAKQRKVFLRLPGRNGTIPATVLLTDTVTVLSRRIQERFGIPTSSQQLYVKSVLLEGHKPLNQYTIESGSIIDVVDQHQVVAKTPSLLLFIKTPDRTPVRVECLAGDTILSVKEKVSLILGIEPARQLLLLAGNALEDAMTINSYNIENETTLHLMLRSEHSEPVQVFVRTLRGKTISLLVRLTDTVREVKAEIQKREGIPSEHQNLLVRGQPLNDSLKLKDCNIESESTLYLTLTATASGGPSDDITIFIKSMTGKILDIRVSRSNTIREVKEKIASIENVPVESQKLCLGGMELMDDVILSKYSIQMKCMLNLQIRDPPSPRFIYFRNLLGKNVAVKVLPTDTVRDLKSKISEKEGIPAEQQRLVLRGRSLEDGELVEHYKIEEESNLQLALLVPDTPPKREEELLSIYVRMVTGKIVTVEIAPSALVRELKEKIHAMKGLSPTQQRFFLNGVELDDNVTLESCHLDLQTTLQLTIRAPEASPTSPIPPATSPSPSSSSQPLTDIFVKTPLGKTVTISVLLDEKISDVKAKISKKAGISPASQTLIFQGKELQDDRLLASYGIDRESNLVVAIKAELPEASPTSLQIPSPVSVSVLVSKHSSSVSVRVHQVDNVSSVNEILRHLEEALRVPQTRLRLFFEGQLLTEGLSRLLKQNTVLILDVLDVVQGPPMTGIFDGRNPHFMWQEKGLQVQLPTRTSIASIMVQECSLSSKFTFPSSARPISKVYELSCTHREGSNFGTSTGAEITIPFASSDGRYGLSFFQASRSPSYLLCNLSPVYCFHTVKGGLFNGSQARAKLEVKEFDCLLCICSQT